jgi:parvulin-like peptidyl-prolyl isomerase
MTAAGAPRATIAAAFAILVSACPADPRDEAARAIVAHVGPVAIASDTLLAELAWAGVARQPAEAERNTLARAILERMIDHQLLLALAKKNGVVVEREDVEREVTRAAQAYPPGTFERVLHGEQMTLEAFARRTEERLLVERTLRRELHSDAEPAAADVDARYQSTVANAPRPAQVLARQVLVRTDEEAQHILAEIRAGKHTVESAARRFSVAPEAESGGLLGWFAQSELPEVFDLCFAMTPGQTSDVVASDYGFHIFELIDRREAGVEPIERARARVSAELRREREEAAQTALLRTLRATTPITVDAVALAQAVRALPPPPQTVEKGPDPSPDGELDHAGPPPEGE